jgi:hypothetical protein
MLCVNVFSYLTSDEIMSNLIMVNRHWLGICQHPSTSSLIWKQMGHITFRGGEYLRSFEHIIMPSMANEVLPVTSLTMKSAEDDPCDAKQMVLMIDRSEDSLKSLSVHIDPAASEEDWLICGESYNGMYEEITLDTNTLMSKMSSLQLIGPWSFFDPSLQEYDSIVSEWELPSLTSLDLRYTIDGDSFASNNKRYQDYHPRSRPIIIAWFHRLRILILSGPITCQRDYLEYLLHDHDSVSDNHVRESRFALPLLEHFVFDNHHGAKTTNMLLYRYWLPTIGHQLQTLALQCPTSDDVHLEDVRLAPLEEKQWPLLHTISINQPFLKGSTWSQLIAPARPSLHHLIINSFEPDLMTKDMITKWCYPPKIISLIQYGSTEGEYDSTEEECLSCIIEFVHPLVVDDGHTSHNADTDKEKKEMVNCMTNASAVLIPPVECTIPSKYMKSHHRSSDNSSNRSSSSGMDDEKSDKDRYRNGNGRMVHYVLPPQHGHDNIDDTKKVGKKPNNKEKNAKGTKKGGNAQPPKWVIAGLPMPINCQSFLLTCHLNGIWLQIINSRFFDIFKVKDGITEQPPFFDIRSIQQSSATPSSSSSSSSSHGYDTQVNRHSTKQKQHVSYSDKSRGAIESVTIVSSSWLLSSTKLPLTTPTPSSSSNSNMLSAVKDDSAIGAIIHVFELN